MSEPARDYRATTRTVWPSYQPDRRPLRDVQLETLNRALNDEVLRHAETRLALIQLMSLFGSRVEHRVVEHVQEVVVVRKETSTQKESRRHARTKHLNLWLLRLLSARVEPKPKPKRREGPKYTPEQNATRRRERSKIPVAIEHRDALTGSLKTPLRLRSGVVIEPAGLLARKGTSTAVFGDAAWRVICVLAQRPGVFLTAEEIKHTISGDGTSALSSVRSAVWRARSTLKEIGADGSDIEPSPVPQGGWRLMTARMEARP